MAKRKCLEASAKFAKRSGAPVKSLLQMGVRRQGSLVASAGLFRGICSPHPDRMPGSVVGLPCVQ